MSGSHAKSGLHIVLLAVLLLAAAGCSSLKVENDRIDYKSQGSKLPPLEIPPDLTKPSADDRFAVPDINTQRRGDDFRL